MKKSEEDPGCPHCDGTGTFSAYAAKRLVGEQAAVGSITALSRCRFSHNGQEFNLVSGDTFKLTLVVRTS